MSTRLGVWTWRVVKTYILEVMVVRVWVEKTSSLGRATIARAAHLKNVG